VREDLQEILEAGLTAADPQRAVREKKTCFSLSSRVGPRRCSPTRLLLSSLQT
jgi:hypothetical protein